jgi:predicted nucleic acid-binding protein
MTLVDTNILLDVVSADRRWMEWSLKLLALRTALGPVFINEVVYAEMAARMNSEAELEEALTDLEVQFDRVPKPALFLAGKSFRHYRSSGGVRTGVLPDFFIGAHAQVLGWPLLTRDVRRYKTYFPKVVLIAPDSAALGGR